MSHSSSTSSTPRARGRGRRQSRGGFGKYIRARATGHRFGRPAEFQERLLLEGERPEELDETDAAELGARYARRALDTNTDRYEESEPAMGPDGRNSTNLHDVINVM
jgi:hypothetical protein